MHGNADTRDAFNWHDLLINAPSTVPETYVKMPLDFKFPSFTCLTMAFVDLIPIKLKCLCRL